MKDMSLEEVDDWLKERGFSQFSGQGLSGKALKNATLDALGLVFSSAKKMEIFNLIGERDEYLLTPGFFILRVVVFCYVVFCCDSVCDVVML